MSLRKLCFFTILVTMVAFVAVRRFNVPINKFDVPTPNSRPHDTLSPMRRSGTWASREINQADRTG